MKKDFALRCLAAKIVTALCRAVNPPHFLAAVREKHRLSERTAVASLPINPSPLTPPCYYRIYSNVFSWDARKALASLKKHGVSFDEAVTAFDDPAGLDFDDVEHSETELRSVRIGFSALGRVLYVVYTARVKHGKETFRIISARQTTRKERASYAG